MEVVDDLQTPAPAPTPVIDHDDLALQAALAEQQALEQPANPATPTDPAATAQPAAPQVPAEPAATLEPEAPGQHKGNPTAALIAMRKQLQQVAAQNLLLQGQVQALSSVAARPQDPQAQDPAAPAEPDPLDDLQSQREALAERFDAGEITAKQWEAQRHALDRQERELLDRQWEERFQQARQPAVAPDLQLEQATAQLEQQYPVLAVLTPDDLAPLRDIAYRQAEREGKPIQAGALGTLDLRTRMAQLAQQMYGGGQPAAAPQQPPTPAALSPQAQARANKLDLAAAMPPDISKMGSAASAAPPSEADLLSRMGGMTEDEQLALLATMPGLTAKILGTG